MPETHKKKGKTVCIVQARRRSSRLPDKTLKLLSGEPILAHVLKRCMAIPSVDEVICAGVDDPYEEPLFDIATNAGASVFKGSEKDVLSRYYHAAKNTNATWVMRVTSDCPFFDPDVADALTQNTQNADADYGGNGGWPHGLDCEIFKFKVLQDAFTGASTPEDREHVTLWMKQNPDLVKYNLPGPALEKTPTSYRWVVDYPEDYDFLLAVHKALGKQAITARYSDILALMKRRPELMDINAKCVAAWAKQTAAAINKKPT